MTEKQSKVIDIIVDKLGVEPSEVSAHPAADADRSILQSSLSLY